MSTVKVTDLNEESKVEPTAPEPIEEEDQQQPEIINEVVEELNEENANAEPPETPAEQPKPKPKAKPKASDIVNCPDCSRSMTYKKLRYSHKCSPEPPPVKKQANPKPKAKQQAKPKQVRKPPPDFFTVKVAMMKRHRNN